jgi:hypothetical protein
MTVIQRRYGMGVDRDHSIGLPLERRRSSSRQIPGPQFICRAVLEVANPPPCGRVFSEQYEVQTEPIIDTYRGVQVLRHSSPSFMRWAQPHQL